LSARGHGPALVAIDGGERLLSVEIGRSGPEMG
jgi:hypothetical protein